MEYYSLAMGWIENLAAERGLIVAILAVWGGGSVVLLAINLVLSAIFKTPSSSAYTSENKIQTGFQTALTTYHKPGEEPYSMSFHKQVGRDTYATEQSATTETESGPAVPQPVFQDRVIEQNGRS